jgi:PST family polysaccharide transporter
MSGFDKSDSEFDTQTLRSRSIRGAAAISVAQALKFFLNLGSQIVLARLLGPAEFGLIAMVAPVLGLVQVFADLGLLQAVVQQPEITHRQLNAVFWISVGISCAFAAVMMMLAPLLAWMYGEPRVINVTIALASLVVVTGLSTLQTALLTRHMRFTALAISEVSSLATGIVVGVLCARAGFGYWSLVLSQTANSSTNLVLAWILSRWRPSWPAGEATARSMLHFGGNVTISNLAFYINMTSVNVIVGIVFGEVAVGLYDRAWKLASLPLFQIIAPVHRVAVPVLSRMVGSDERYRNAFVQMLQILLLVASPGIVFAMLTAQPLIELMFGQKWLDTAPIFSWLCLGALITPVNTGIFWLFISQGRARHQMIWSAVASAISLLAYCVGLYWGLVGAVRLSALSVWLLQSPLLIWVASREGPVDLRTLLRAIYPFAISSLAAAAALESLASVWPIDGFPGLAVSAALSYAVSVAILACMPSGIKALFSVWNMRTAFNTEER